MEEMRAVMSEAFKYGEIFKKVVRRRVEIRHDSDNSTLERGTGWFNFFEAFVPDRDFGDFASFQHNIMGCGEEVILRDEKSCAFYICGRSIVKFDVYLQKCGVFSSIQNAGFLFEIDVHAAMKVSTTKKAWDEIPTRARPFGIFESMFLYIKYREI